jgi:diguanylate cyclase (GGDEF)-like protein
MDRQQIGSPLTSLDFDHIARIFSTLAPGLSGGALYDFGSRNFRLSFGFTENAKEEVKLLLEEKLPTWESGPTEKLYTRRLSDDLLLFSQVLFNHAQEALGALVIAFQPDSEADSDALQKKMVAAINGIAAIISSNLQLNVELNAMAQELTERYEELNLVYDTVDQAHSFSAVKRALRQLVKNCSVYMDVPYVDVLLLDKKISMHHAKDLRELGNKDAIDKELGKLYTWTLETNRSLVLNESDDPSWAEVKIRLPYKLLSCPVMDKMGNTLGVLVALKDKTAEDFINSDRNLLIVMANKASKIIQTNYDSLTGLLNLEAFEYFLEKIYFSPGQFGPEHHTVLYIDLDHMQVINETMSHQAGDEALQAIAQAIKRLIRDIDIAARIGGDKFGVLLYNCSPDRGMTISQRISNEIKKQEIAWNGKKIQLSACIGLASISSSSKNALSALDDAEIACNAAKEEGKNKISFFKFGDVDLSGKRDEMHWAQMLQDLLDKNKFTLFCQKIQTLKKENGSLYYEILLRAQDDKGYIIEPKKFIPAAERYKMMPVIDRWVISNVLDVLEKFWEGLQHFQAIWSINISGQSIREEGFLDFVLDSMQNRLVPAGAFCFEITETAAIGNLIAAQNLIKNLQKIGCTIALDDFGSGLSSFNYLKNLDIDYIKIDGSIVKDVVENHVARAMVKAVKDVAEALELPTIGEYVENDAIAGQLSRLGIDFAQGYHIGRPVPLENELNGIITDKNPAKGNEEKN